MSTELAERNGTGLTPIEVKSLAEHEATIETGLDTFYEVGAALCAIRDGRLYRQTHDSFEHYCRDRWNMSRIHAHRLIAANGIRERLLPIGNILPANESQARALAGVPEGDRQAVWERVVEEAPVNAAGRPAITAAKIEEVAQAIAWEKLSPEEKEMKTREEEIREYAQGLDGMLRRGARYGGGIDGDSKDKTEDFPKSKEEYFEKRDNEEWERQWQEKSEQEAREVKERDEQRRNVRPYLNIYANADKLKRMIREYLRMKIVYRFHVEDDYATPERKASWPPQFAEVAIGVLESVAKEIRADLDKWFWDPPTHPWQHDEDDCELDCKWDEINYDQSVPCPPSKRKSMTKKEGNLSTTEAIL